MSDTSTPAPPIPVPDSLSQGFWDHAAEGRLAAWRCDACGTLAYPPQPVCTNCQADPPRFTWAPLSGAGTVATWTVVRDALLPGFAADAPYVVAEVEVPEQTGLRIVARLRGIAIDDVRVGLPVQVAFADGGEGTKVPVFEGAGS